MQSIILVGGFGTRLGALTKDTPKPMLPIRGVPYLEFFLKRLKREGFEKVVLATGFKSDVIESHFTVANNQLPRLEFSFEESPLGTGGAIAKALNKITNDVFFVFNGDSYLDVDFALMQNKHFETGADLTVASRFISPADRYGVLSVDRQDRVMCFEEKGAKRQGVINGGIYLCNRAQMKKTFLMLDKDTFSFEEEILSSLSDQLKIFHFLSKGFFIDIGIPKDYKRAQSELFL